MLQEGGGRRAARVLTTPGTLQNVQMRPDANSLMFAANRISKPQPQPQLQPVQQSEYPPIQLIYT